MSNIEIKKKFFKQGYIVLKQFVNKKKINNLLISVNNLLADANKKKGKRTLQNIDKNYLKLKKNNKVLKSKLYDSFKKLENLNSIFQDSRIVKLSKDIMNSDILLDNTQIRIDDPNNDRILDFHQELHQISLINLTAWVPLKKLNNKVGGLEVIEGSHKNGYMDHVKINKKGYTTKINLKKYKLNRTKKIFIDVGDVLLFHPLLAHASIPNHSNNIRWTAITRYNSTKFLRELHLNGKDTLQSYKKFYNNKKFNWK